MNIMQVNIPTGRFYCKRVWMCPKCTPARAFAADGNRRKVAQEKETPVRMGLSLRDQIIAAAFNAFRREGVKGVGVATVAADVGATKGALYHHFASKDALIEAVLRGPVRKEVFATLVDPFARSDTFAEAIRKISDTLAAPETVSSTLQGCPLNNIVQELSEDFPLALAAARDIFNEWETALADAFARTNCAGADAPHDARARAHRIITALEGSLAMVRSTGDVSRLTSDLRLLADWVGRDCSE